MGTSWRRMPTWNDIIAVPRSKSRLGVPGTYTSISRVERGGGRRPCQAGARRNRKSMAQLAVDHGVALVWPTSVNVIALMHASRKSNVNACGEALHLPELYVRPVPMK